MTTIDTSLTTWWTDRSDEQRATLTRAAEADTLHPDITRLLIDTQCPIGPVGTQWQNDPDIAWSWPNAVREFILEGGKHGGRE